MINAQNIDGISLEMIRMVITMLEIENKGKKLCFFKKTFLFTNFSINVVLKMSFLIRSNIKINSLKLNIF